MNKLESVNRYDRRGFIIKSLKVGGALTAAGFLGVDCSGDQENTKSFSPTPTLPDATETPDSVLQNFNAPLVETSIRPGIEYVTNANIPQNELDNIQKAAEASLDFYHKELGIYVRGNMRYTISNNRQDTRLQANTDGNSISINVGNPGWSTYSDIFKQQIVMHENFHSIQSAISRKTGDRRGQLGNFLLQEGTAYYAGYMGIIDRDMMTYPQVMKETLDIVRSYPKLPPTKDLSNDDKGAVYQLSCLAIDNLVGDYKNGVKKLGEYLKNLHDMPWQDAFQKTFSISIEQFQDNFDIWRSKNI